MLQHRFPLLFIAVLLFAAGCKSVPDTEMLTTTKRLYFRWEPNASVPGGGIIVGNDRGEGSNGRITVEIPIPEPGSTGDIELTHENLMHMTITITTDEGETMSFDDSHIATATYQFTFTHTFDDGSSANVVVSHQMPE
ncbi:MAG: hypothetical protein M5R41_01770 [Bacteroidia bacterium]|nr:hypothetical protein [Bacteroidia bacterium]